MLTNTQREFWSREKNLVDLCYFQHLLMTQQICDILSPFNLSPAKDKEEMLLILAILFALNYSQKHRPSHVLDALIYNGTPLPMAAYPATVQMAYDSLQIWVPFLQALVFESAWISFRLIHTTLVKAFFAMQFFLFDHSSLACTSSISYSIVYYASGDKITESAEFLSTILVIVVAANDFLSICIFYNFFYFFYNFYWLVPEIF